MVFDLKSITESCSKNKLADLQVSKDSFFRDSTWFFLDESSRQLSHMPQSRLTLYWETPILPDSLISELKIVALLLLTEKELSCITVVGLVKEFQSFLSFICEDTAVRPRDSENSFYTIEYISDLDIDLISRGFELYNCCYNKYVLRVLRFLPGSYFSKLVDPVRSNFQWKKGQLRFLKSAIYNAKGGRTRTFLEDDLVFFLISNASYLCYLFLYKLTGEVQYKSEFTSSQHKYVSYFEDVPDFSLVFSYYRQIYTGNFEEYGDTFLRRRIKKVTGRSTEDFQREMFKVQSACFYLVLQFSGIRYSEAVYLEDSDLIDGPFGIDLIKGNVIKHRKSKNLKANDTWVAIPIVKAAFQAIKYINLLTGQSKVFSTAFVTRSKRNLRPMGNNSLSTRLCAFLHDIDVKREYSDDNKGLLSFRHRKIKPSSVISPNRIRQTVANQLIRGGLNVVYLSRHFKHVSLTLHTLFSVPDVTLGYGNISFEIMRDKTLFDKTVREIENAIMTRSNIQGPGALSFKDFRKSISEDKLMDSIVDVGLAFCMGRNKVISESGKLEEPPCVRFGECQPWRCKNSFTTIDKLARLETFLKDTASMLNDLQYSHLYPVLSIAKNASEKIVARLKSDPT